MPFGHGKKNWLCFAVREQLRCSIHTKKIYRLSETSFKKKHLFKCFWSRFTHFPSHSSLHFDVFWTSLFVKRHISGMEKNKKESVGQIFVAYNKNVGPVYRRNRWWLIASVSFPSCPNFPTIVNIFQHSCSKIW